MIGSHSGRKSPTRLEYVCVDRRGSHGARVYDEDLPNFLVSPLKGAGLDYAYHLEIVEDLDDGRVHNEPDSTGAYEDIPRAGFRELIPVHQLAKIFYTDTGKILNLGNERDGENNPVLLVKRDLDASRLSPAITVHTLDSLEPGRRF